MDLIDTLRSTGAVREFTDQPVDDAAVARILDTARFAPSGANAATMLSPPKSSRLFIRTPPNGQRFTLAMENQSSRN